VSVNKPRTEKVTQSWTTLLLFAAWSCATSATVPSTKIGTAALISPTDAETYYQTLLNAHPNATNSTRVTGAPNEVVELAHALNNNVDEI